MMKENTRKRKACIYMCVSVYMSDWVTCRIAQHCKSTIIEKNKK